MTTYDAIVIGLGAHGSAAAYHLAKRGLRVLGLEQFPRGHTLGSSGGLSRIIRLCYAEHPDYVPMLRRAWDLWRELERESGETLLTQTGGLYFGPPEGEIVTGSVRSAREHHLAHELLDADEIVRRFRVFRVEPEWIGLYDVQAGWLAPERCIETHLRMAERHGATLRFGEAASVNGSRVTIGGDVVESDHIIVTAGAWMDRLIPSLRDSLWVERNVLFWFEPRAHVEDFARLPVWIMDDVTIPTGLGRPAYRNYYGFPYDPAQGFKLAGLHFGDQVDPDTVEREPRALDEERIRSFIRRRIPDADGERRLAKVCMYTNSPDGQFIIDRTADGIVYASACSGHGFKFASVIGELLMRMAIDGTEGPAFLRADRLAASH